MTSHELARLMLGERIAVLMVWSIVITLALPDLWKVVRGVAVNGEWKRAVLVLIGLGCITYQFRGLSGRVIAPPEFGSFFALTQFLAAGLIVILVWDSRAPDGHKRAAILSHLAVVILGAVAGLCF